MKRTLSLIILFLIVHFSYAQQRTEKDLSGKWIAVESEALGLDFVKPGTVNIEVGASKPIPVNYKANYTDSLIAVEMTVPRKAGNQILKSEITFLNSNTIKWRIIPGSVVLPFPGPTDASGAVAITMKRIAEIAEPTSADMPRSENDLLGKWNFQLKPSNGIIFSKDDKVAVFQDQEKINFNYTADFSKAPIAILMTVTEGGQTFTIKGEIVFLNADTIKWRVFKGDLPLTDFGKVDKDGAVTSVLIRAK